MSFHADLWIIRQALDSAPVECRYHGTDFDRLGRQGSHGEPRCDTCRPAWRTMCARAALRRVQETLA